VTVNSCLCGIYFSHSFRFCVVGWTSACLRVYDDNADSYYVLAVSNSTSIGHVGQVRWHVTLCLSLAWIIVFVCILKGVKSSGKVCTEP